MFSSPLAVVNAVPETVPVLLVPPKFTAPAPLPKRMPPAPSVFALVMVKVTAPAVLKRNVFRDAPAHAPAVVTLMLFVEAVKVLSV